MSLLEIPTQGAKYMYTLYYGPTLVGLMALCPGDCWPKPKFSKHSLNSYNSLDQDIRAHHLPVWLIIHPVVRKLHNQLITFAQEG